MSLSKKQQGYFKAAATMASKSNHRCHIGCVVVNNHRIISYGCNSKDRKHAFQATIDKKFFNCECPGYLHAETATLLPLIKQKVDLTNATIYVYREYKNGDLAPSRPCPRCMSVIKSCGIQKIHYTTIDGYATEHIKY